MLVGMYYNNGKVPVETTDIPPVSDNDILMKVKACGICGSDVMEWYRIQRAPLVLGHELTGDIVEVGRNITRFKRGDRIFSTHHVPCDRCHYCLRGHTTACEVFQRVNNHYPGGFSQYLRISGKSVETGTCLLPDTMTYEQGTFIEPLATAVRALRTARLHPGDSELILGSGIIGLLMLKLARALGAGRIFSTDIDPFRLEKAKEYGAEFTAPATDDLPSFIKKNNGGRLADTVIICTGALSAAQQAFSCVDKGGTITVFAVARPGETVAVDFNPLWRNDVTVNTCYGGAPLDTSRAMELIRVGAVTVDEMITHRFPLQDIGKGFSMACSGKECVKVLIYPNG